MYFCFEYVLTFIQVRAYDEQSKRLVEPNFSQEHEIFSLEPESSNLQPESEPKTGYHDNTDMVFEVLNGQRSSMEWFLDNQQKIESEQNQIVWNISWNENFRSK